MRHAFVVLGLLLVAWSSPVLTTGADAQVPKHNCSFCHSLHGGPSQTLFGPLLPEEVIEDVCFTCHSDTGFDQVDRDGTLVDVPKGPYDVHNGGKHVVATGCWDCHNHEGEAGLNLAMIQEDMPTPDPETGEPTTNTRTVAFTSRGTDAGQGAANSFADGDGTYDGVCEVCHTKTSNHGNGDPGDSSNHGHEAGRTCSTCHTHDKGFAGGGPCRDCHNSAQDNDDGLPTWRVGRREVLSEFSRASHHVDFTGDFEDADCEACHDQSQHQEGIVRLWNVDQPGDTAASIKLLGDPSTTASEAAKLEAFCLACHDSGGSGPSQPFTDGNTPPEISSSAWSVASHKNATEGYTCWDCHDTGHGSEKRKLLEPATVAPDSGGASLDALYFEEEGFCFECHKSGGATGASDVEGQFLVPIRWVQDAWGLQSIPTFNDRHDVQFEAQDSSGAKIECTDCHDPHTATSAQPWKSDPDPGNTPLWTTGSALSQFCVDCHDGTVPSTVVPIHRSVDRRGAVDSLYMSNLDSIWWGAGLPAGGVYPDAMGVFDGGTGANLLDSVYVAAGFQTNDWVSGDIMECADCHRPHPKLLSEYGTTDPLLQRDYFGMVDTVSTKAGEPMAYYEVVSSMGSSSLVTYWEYSLTTDGGTGADGGGYFCNTCHNRPGMNGNSTCGSSNCHAHGGSPGM